MGMAGKKVKGARGQIPKKTGKLNRTLYVTSASYFADDDTKPRGLQLNHFSDYVGFRVGFGIQTPILGEETTDI